MDTTDDTRATPLRTAAVAYAIVFVAFVDTFAMLPTVAPYADSLGASVVGVGIAVGAYSVTNLLFNVVGGVLLDRIGRRRLLLGGLIASALSMAGYAAASDPITFVIARLVHGASEGILIPAVFTVIGDLAPRGSQGRTMGRAGAVIGMAAVVAPGLAGALRQAAGFGPVFATVAACMLIGAVLVLVGLPETRPRQDRTETPAAWGDLARRPSLRAGFTGTFAFTFAVGSLAAFLPLHVESLGFDAAASGGLFTGFALVAAVVMLSRFARSVDTRGVVPPAATGLAIIAVALGLLGLEPQMGATLAAALVFGFGYGLVFPATSGVMAIATTATERGRTYALYNVFFSLGLATGPALGGVIASTGLTPFAPAVLVCVTAVLVLAGMAKQLRPGNAATAD